MNDIWNHLRENWAIILLDILGKAFAVLAGFLASWYLLFRRRLREIQRFQQGDSDDILFQMHQLVPVRGTEDVTLVFRNVGPRMTINTLYDNLGARDLARKLAEGTSLMDPILKTNGPDGFELVNIGLGFIAGELATSPFDRELWYFTMTCEDGQVVRKRCIRCFLIRPEELDRFKDWEWCQKHVRVERPWHAFRIAALHRIALHREEEERITREREQGLDITLDMPAVQQDVWFARIRPLSLGLYTKEQPISEPLTVDWNKFLGRLKEMGLEVEEGRESEQAGA